MTHLHSIEEQVENEASDERQPMSNDSHQHLRLRSFIDRYGIEQQPLSKIEWIRRYATKKCSSFNIARCIDGFFNHIPLIRCLVKYNIRQDLFGDIVAGITVAIMHIPQGKCLSIINGNQTHLPMAGMAYGALTMLPPVHGKRSIADCMTMFYSIACSRVVRVVLPRDCVYDLWHLATSIHR